MGGRLFVHVRGDPYALVSPITRIIRELSADQPVERAATLEDVRAEVLTPDRLNTLVFGGFAAVALAIALVGVAGVLAFSVSADERVRHPAGDRIAAAAAADRRDREGVADGTRGRLGARSAASRWHGWPAATSPSFACRARGRWSERCWCCLRRSAGIGIAGGAGGPSGRDSGAAIGVAQLAITRRCLCGRFAHREGDDFRRSPPVSYTRLRGDFEGAHGAVGRGPKQNRHTVGPALCDFVGNSGRQVGDLQEGVLRHSVCFQLEAYGTAAFEREAARRRFQASLERRHDVMAIAGTWR